MSDRPTPLPLLTTVGRACRAAVVALLSGWLTRRSYYEVEASLARRAPGVQVALVGGVLAVLFALALLAAQAGIVGLAAYLAAVVLLAR